jgi:uncharacterized membrane protein YhhN
VNHTASVLLVIACAVAVVDWIAVGFGWRWLEYVCKPGTMVFLIAAALTLDPVDGATRAWFVVALVFSMFGDVFLMLPKSDTWFVPGLASFLVGHVAYSIGFVASGVNALGLALGIVAVTIAVATVAPRVVAGARATDPRLGGPVLGYVFVISAMVACAVGSMIPAAIAGAVLFYLSDLTIGWSRFVKDFPASRLVVMTTYHTAQILLVLSLVVTR